MTRFLKIFLIDISDNYAGQTVSFICNTECHKFLDRALFQVFEEVLFRIFHGIMLLRRKAQRCYKIHDENNNDYDLIRIRQMNNR